VDCLRHDVQHTVELLGQLERQAAREQLLDFDPNL
jgi:hypothetical protein